MKTRPEKTQSFEQPIAESKTRQVIISALCLSIFPLMYIVGKTLIQLINQV